MSANGPLYAALKASQLMIREYVKALQAENAKLQRRIAQLEAKDVSRNCRIRELENEFKRLGHKTIATELGERLDAAKKRLGGTQR